MEEQREKWSGGETVDSLLEMLTEVEAALGQVLDVGADDALTSEQGAALQRAHAGVRGLLEQLPSCAEELRRPRDALRASEKRLAEVDSQHQLLQAVSDSSPVGIAVVDARELRARWYNPTALHFLDEPFRSQGVMGLPLQEFIPHAEESGLVAIFRQVAATGQPYIGRELEHDGLKRGTTYWDWSLQRLPPAAGEGEALLLVMNYEVTEQVLARRAAERAAAELEEANARLGQEHAFLEAVMRQMPAGVVIADAPSGRLLLANEQARRIWRYPQDAFAETVADYGQCSGFYSDQLPLRAEEWPLARAIATGQTVRNVEIEIVRGDGTRGVIVADATPIANDRGQVTAGVVTFYDVTERKELERSLRQARDELELRVRERTAELAAANEALQSEIAVRRQVEADLRESEARFRQLAEHIGEMVFLVESTTGKLLYVSPVYERLWGRPAQDLYDDLDIMSQGIHPEDRDRVRAAVKKTRLDWDVEFRVIHTDGSLRWVRSRAYPVATEPGVAPRVAGITEDVTLQKEAQEALVRAERMRTAGQLAASLSHEINNPLQSAMGSLDLAREALSEGRPVDRYLAVSHDALRRTAGVMAQMRGLLSMDVGDAARAVRVNDLLHKAVLLTDTRCEAMKVRVVLDLASDVPCVKTVPTALQQVFLNLLLNAVDATAEGGQVRIATEYCPERRRVWVRFADPGPGIAPEIRERLFEPFQTTKAGELGLGLFISRNLVQQMGGGIEVESEVGQGTTVSVWLPV